MSQWDDLLLMIVVLQLQQHVAVNKQLAQICCQAAATAGRSR